MMRRCLPFALMLLAACRDAPPPPATQAPVAASPPPGEFPLAPGKEPWAEREKRMPTYEQYPARDTFAGEPAPVVLDRPKARKFRTMLREGAAKGPNFAGHYTVVEWGCGSPCHDWAIVDARTGRVAHMSDEPAVLGTGHRLDSQLLVVDPPALWREAYGSGVMDAFSASAYYYRWDGARLIPLDSLPLGRGP